MSLEIASEEKEYVIIDLKRREAYIPKKWKTEKEAKMELYELLKPFSENNEWRKRLAVRASHHIKRQRNAPTTWDSAKWKAEKEDEEIRAIAKESQSNSEGEQA